MKHIVQSVRGDENVFIPAMVYLAEGVGLGCHSLLGYGT